MDLCFQVNYTQLGKICNLWRNYGDIQDSWDSVLNIIDWFSENQEVLVAAAGPGRWNDPDMVSLNPSIKGHIHSLLSQWCQKVKEKDSIVFTGTFTADRWRLWPQHGAVSYSDGSVGHYGCSSFHVQRPAHHQQRCPQHPAEQNGHQHQPGPHGSPGKTHFKGVRLFLWSAYPLLVTFMFIFWSAFIYISSCQEKSGIEVFWRPLMNNASALVFFSRRTDMPYRYQTSLGKLNYTAGSYKVCLSKLL